jgi:WD40 repeat protein
MLVLAAGARVTQVRFLPDGRLLVGTWAAGDAELGVWTLPAGPPVRIPLSVRQVWDGHNQLAVLGGGDRLLLGLGGLVTVSTADGQPVPGGPDGPANQVIATPDGRRVVAAYPTPDGGTVVYGLATGERAWETVHPYTDPQRLVGFLPAGERFAVVGSQQVAVRSFAPDGKVEATPYHANSARDPQLSPNGRHAGIIGYSAMYVYDTAALGKPLSIKGSGNFGNFVGFAFHPAGRALAVIHGGPTLVKLYDLDTLKLRAKLNWKVGKLTCVAFSGDGLLAAAGTEDGRVVVWDVDE